uniref:Palmitoyl-protein hydrolase n=1 Tax=Panagrolaimus sp. JU765 TaxID=591449 RepID=A0AC34QZN8_9BILA
MSSKTTATFRTLPALIAIYSAARFCFSQRTFTTTAKTFNLLEGFLGGGGQRSGGSDQIMSVHGAAPYVIKPSGKHTATLFFFHGLGDQGAGWADVFRSEIVIPHLKVVCPNAGVRPVTLNFGMAMPAWYDLFGLSASSPEDVPGIQKATEYVHGLIEAEIKEGIPAEKIFVGGFSMGGALAIYAGLTYDKPLGGLVGLSSFLLQRDKLPGNHTANLKTPVFLGHGTNDFLVPLQFGQLTKDAIAKFNPNIELKTYPMDHSSCPQELRDVKDFLNKNLK